MSARTGEKLLIRLENAITAGENRLYPSAEAYRADLRAIAAQIANHDLSQRGEIQRLHMELESAGAITPDELAERYIEIPVDVNGELCKCGDEIHLTDEDERLMVCGYTVGEDGFVSLYCSKLKDGRRWFPTVMTYASEVEHADSIGRVALDMRDSISEHVGLDPDEVLAFVERLQRLEGRE